MASFASRNSVASRKACVEGVKIGVKKQCFCEFLAGFPREECRFSRVL